MSVSIWRRERTLTYGANVCFVMGRRDGVGVGGDVATTMVLDAGRGVDGGVGCVEFCGKGDSDAAGMISRFVLTCVLCLATLDCDVFADVTAR